jgi:hypothetical protein
MSQSNLFDFLAPSIEAVEEYADIEVGTSQDSGHGTPSSSLAAGQNLMIQNKVIVNAKNVDLRLRQELTASKRILNDAIC